MKIGDKVIHYQEPNIWILPDVIVATIIKVGATVYYLDNERTITQSDLKDEASHDFYKPYTKKLFNKYRFKVRGIKTRNIIKYMKQMDSYNMDIANEIIYILLKENEDQGD